MTAHQHATWIEPVQPSLLRIIAGVVAEGLRRRGIEILTLAEAEMLGASGAEHFVFAREEGRTIVTHDDDFLRLAAQAADHAGVVYLPQR